MSENKNRFQSTVFLPKTDFPLKPKPGATESALLKYWAETDLYQQLRSTSAHSPQFTLHDGPPYANGNIHIGHALNHVLKDIIVRSRQLAGLNVNYVPGWDCHGLPIEWAVEKQYRDQGVDKDSVPVLDFLSECRKFAQGWVDAQRKDLKRLGIEGDWDNPYLTMSPESEAQIVREFHKFLLDGSLYCGTKPVAWSVVEQTALSEAETEYKEKKSPTIFVRFPLDLERNTGTSVVIWTTTPWSLPGNRAIAFSPSISYGCYQVKEVEDTSLACIGEKLILADTLAESVKSAAKIVDWERVKTESAVDLSGLVCRHPFYDHGYDFDVCLVEGHHVTDESGTGFVHIAPGHGLDDYKIGLTYKLPVPDTVGPDGLFYDHVPMFAGESVLTKDGKEGTATGAIIKALLDNQSLLAKGSLRHKYPHSWRSKAPLIYRHTAQWFVSMTENGLKEKALSEIDQVNWVPNISINRIKSMVESRPDWVLSRQRKWGVPLALFVHKSTGEVLRDPEVCERIATAFEQQGVEAWWSDDPKRFLGDQYNPDDYDVVNDILDVWFDSASSHAFCLDKRDDLSWPADVYLEGSDQHRGWFQSSLLHACGTRGKAPYRTVITHGFVLDEKGNKMSKSEKNVVSPQDACKKHGADVLRLWAASVDYNHDMKIGENVLKSVADTYRKIRNTIRFLLGSLKDYDTSEEVSYENMPELEQYVLHLADKINSDVWDGYRDYNFSKVVHAVSNFCSNDLSAFYFEIRKDSLYCDSGGDQKRLACRTVLEYLFNKLTEWMSPILVFTMEEAWLTRYPDSSSVHLRALPEIGVRLLGGEHINRQSYLNDRLAQKWTKVRQVRSIALHALELQRSQNRIGQSLEAQLGIYVSDPILYEELKSVSWAEVTITSHAYMDYGRSVFGYHYHDGDVEIYFKEASGNKCERCWKISPEVTETNNHLCERCLAVVDDLISS